MIKRIDESVFPKFINSEKSPNGKIHPAKINEIIDQVNNLATGKLDYVYSNIYYLPNFDNGGNFGKILQNAIDTVPPGSVIDTTYYTGIQEITVPVSINKPVKIIFGYIDVRATLAADQNCFNIVSDGVTLLGQGRSTRGSQLNGPTKMRMMSAGSGYHIYSKGCNVLRFQDFDCIGIQSTPYSTNGAGGVVVIEPNPFVVGGGNNVNQLVIDGVFCHQTKSHGFLLLGGILTIINNSRVSASGGHGFYIGSASTSTFMQNCYASSGTLAGFCMDSASYSAFINCASEGFGMGFWIKSCFNVSGIGLGCEQNQTRTTSGLPNNMGLFFDNTEASATIQITDFNLMATGSHQVSLTNATGTSTLTLTAVAAGPGADDFVAATSNSVTATNLAAAINAHAGNANYTATATGSRVRVAWDTLGGGVGNTFSASGGTTPSSAALATGQILDDIGSDNVAIFKGTSYIVSGGRNIYLANPYSKDPGQASQGASSTTRHYSVRGLTRAVYLVNPRCVKSSEATGTPRFDIAIEALGSDIPRDVNCLFNPSQDGTITGTTNTNAGIYVTNTNSSAESTVVLDEGANTEIKNGADYYTAILMHKPPIYHIPAKAAINATATATSAQVKTGCITSTSAAPTTITLPSATALATQLLASQGSSFYLVVDNSAGANTVTVALGSGITQLTVVPNGGAGALTIAAGSVGKFEFYFTSTTAARISRVY